MPPRQALPVLSLPSTAIAGSQAVAIAAANTPITESKGWMWDPFLWHSVNHVNLMHHNLKNVIPPRMGRAMLQHIPRVFSPGIRSRLWKRQGLEYGAPLAGVWCVLGVPPPLSPLPAPRLKLPPSQYLPSPGVCYRMCLEATALLELRMWRTVLWEG